MELPYFDVSEIINNVLECYSEKRRISEKISINDIQELCQKASSIFLQEDGLLEIMAPIKILGDIHGYFSILLEWFSIGGQLPYTNYLFLGDYIDRGRFSIETIILLLCYKLKYPKNIFLLRGNHECASICRIYGFYDECKKKYSIKIWKAFVQCFNCMPLAAIVGEKIFCVHAGLGPELESLKQINDIIRPTKVPEEGLLYDLLWKEIDNNNEEYESQNAENNHLFGKKVIDHFLRKNGLELICRSHQLTEKGYEYFAEGKLVTIFSVPSYLGVFDNLGSMMIVDESLTISFHVIDKKNIRI